MNTLSALAQLPDYLRLVIVTSSKAIDVNPTVEQAGLSERFEAKVFGDDVRNHKPHPEPYELALSKLGLPADACVAFEDSESGIGSATAAGLRVRRVSEPASLPSLLRTEILES